MKYINKFASIEAGNERLDLKAPQLALVNNQKVCSKRIAAKKFVEFTEDEIDSHIELVEVTPEICLTFANGETVRLVGEVDGDDVVLTEEMIERFDPERQSITEIVISSPITKLGVGAFNWQENLQTVVIGDSVTEIGVYAFQGNTNLTNITLPSGLTKINEGTFAHCWSLNTIVIPDTVTEIGASAFEQHHLTEITLPDNLETIGNSAFNYGWGGQLNTVIIPGSVKTIGDWAFEGNTGLTTITLNEGLESIGKCAFMTNGAFPNTITIPSTVTNIGDGAFGESNWESQWPPTAYFSGTKQQWISRFGTEGYIFSWKYYHGPNYTQVTLCTIPIHCANNETVDYTSLGWEAPKQE